LNTAVAILKSLLDFVQHQRGRFDEFEALGKRLCINEKYSEELRRPRHQNVRLQPLDLARGEEVVLTAKENFLTKSFLPCIDTLLVCLKSRINAYAGVCDRFGFLLNFPSMDPDSIMAAADNLLRFYSNDFDDTFGSELVQFQSFLSAFLDQKPTECTLERYMYSLLIEKDVVATFPNTTVALKIYLTLMITNSTGERSFSKMKLVKNLLRSSMGQERLNHLTVMSLESDILRQVDISDVLHIFATGKARKTVLP
jgi:hypothetical protein